MSELLPTNIEAEEAILGGILIDPHALGRVIDVLKPYHFAISAHTLIYRAILEVKKAGHPIDLMTVTFCLADSDWLEEAGGQSKLAQLAERTVSAVNIDSYAELLIDKYIRRRIIFAANDAVKLGYDASRGVEEIEQEIASAFATIKLERAYAKEPSKLTTSLFDWAIQAPPKPTQWLVHDLFRCGDIILFSGDPGSGKSTILSSIFRCLAKGENCLGKKVRKSKVLWHTSDEPEDDLFTRLTGKWRIEPDNPECWSKNFIKLDSTWNFHRLNEIEQILEADRAQDEALRIKAICIDSLASAIAYPLGVEINSAEIGGHIKSFKPLADKYGCAIFIIHHNNKDRDAKGLSRANGSRTIVNHSDMMVSVAGEPRQGVIMKALKVRGVVAPWELKAVLEHEPHVMGIEGSLSCHLVLQSYERQDKPKAEDDDIDLKLLSPHDAISIFLYANKGKWYRRAEMQAEIGHTGAYQDDKYKDAIAKMLGDGEIAVNPTPKNKSWPEYGHVDNRVPSGTQISEEKAVEAPPTHPPHSESAQDIGLSPAGALSPPLDPGVGAPTDTTSECSMPVVENGANTITPTISPTKVRSNEFKVGDRVRIARGSDTGFDWHTGTIKKLFLLANPQEANLDLEKKVSGKTKKLTVHLSKLEVLHD